MSEIERLRKEREAELQAAETLAATAKEEDRDLTDEEVEQIEGHAARAKELAGEIEEAQKSAKRRADALAAVADARDWGNQTQEPIISRRPDPSPQSKPKIVGGEGASTFRHFGEFLFRVYDAARTPGVGGDLERKIQAASGLNTAVDSEGGFLIPPTYANEILRRMYERGEILGRCRKFTLSGNELKIPYVNESSRADGSRWGGVRAWWTEEGGTPSAGKPDFGQLSLRTKKVMCLAYVTDEQLADAAATSDILLEACSDEMLFAIENAIFAGTGAGQPLGILGADCTVSQAKETNQTAATVWGPNVTKMWARCWARSRSNAVWVVEQSTEPYLYGLMVEGRYGSASTSADGVPLYLPAGSVNNTGPFATLMGRPVIPVEYAKAVGTVGDIVLADFSQYIVADKGGVDSAQSMHVRFIYGEQTFRFQYRIDGRPWWQAALTPHSGGDSLSPFVTLAARS